MPAATSARQQHGDRQDPHTAEPPGAEGHRPDRLMVFDGLCNMCSASVRMVLRLDRAGAIRFTAIQSPYGRHLSRRHGIDPDDPGTFMYFDRGRALKESDAILAMLAHLPRPWRWLRVFKLVPRPLRDAGYRWLARRRYRLFGKRDACMTPTPQMRARFIDEVPADSGVFDQE